MPAQVYRFGTRIAAGGLGEVYRGESLGEGYQRAVAIKLLKVPKQNQEDIEARFRDEARLMAYLRHPSIIKMEAMGRLEGRLVLVMELVDGVDLERIRRHMGRMPPRAVVEVIVAVASALKEAWTAPGPDGQPMEIIHRDIKPANIAIDRHGMVKVLDFGAARAQFAGREAETVQGAWGTAEYAAPERLRDQNPIHHLPAIDIWALGATAAELLLGQPWGVVRQDFREQLQEAEVPPALIELLVAMLSPNPGRRPDAEQVEERSEGLFRLLEGPGLRVLARQVVATMIAVPEPQDERFGREFSVVGTTKYAPPPPPRPPAPPGDRKAGPPEGLPSIGWVLARAVPIAVVIFLGLLALLWAGSAGLRVWKERVAAPQEVAAAEAPAVAPAPKDMAQAPSGEVQEDGITTATTQIKTEPKEAEIPNKKPTTDSKPAPKPKNTVVAQPAPETPTPTPEKSQPTAATMVATSTPPPPKPTVALVDVRLEGSPGVTVRLYSTIQYTLPGALPAGSYTLRATFAEDPPGTTPLEKKVEIRNGPSVTVKCSARSRDCVVL